MLYGHLIAYKEFVYSGDLFYENRSKLQFSIGCALPRVLLTLHNKTFLTSWQLSGAICSGRLFWFAEEALGTLRVVILRIGKRFFTGFPQRQFRGVFLGKKQKKLPRRAVFSSKRVEKES